MMGRRHTCCECNTYLNKDERALSIKLFGDISDEFYCIACMALVLDCEEEDLRIKIDEFKEQGCALFM